MFKYGSFRLFLIKFIFGFFFIIFAISLLISLLTYSPEDPGFKKIVYVDNIKNALGFFGAKLSSTMLVFWGHYSYIIFLFFIIKGFKLILGITNVRFLIRGIFLIFGIICINFFLKIIELEKFEYGLLLLFSHNLIFESVLTKLNNIIFIYGISFIFFLTGMLMLIYSLSIRIKFIKYFFIIFVPLKFIFNLTFFKSLISVFKIFNSNNYKKYSGKTITKNEPTIKKHKNNLFNSNLNSVNPSDKNQADAYSYHFPSFDMLLKSPKKDIYTREIEKLNINYAKKLEETLSEYEYIIIDCQRHYRHCCLRHLFDN